MIDKIYKIGLLLLGIIFLILFYQYNQKNRYQLDKDEGVFDTNSGRFYSFPGLDKLDKDGALRCNVLDLIHGTKRRYLYDSK